MRATRISFDMVDNYISENIQSEDNEIENPILREIVTLNLTKKQKCYIMLYYKDGLTMEEIAKRCKVSKSTVSRTIFRGRTRLLDNARRTALSRLLSERK